MRKAVERVDVGVFGIPMRVRAWTRARRSTVVGIVAMSLAQAAIGTLVALAAGVALGVDVNAFSISLLLFFAVGCAIGGPISFAVWSLVLIGLTGVVAGVVMGAWVTSPAWWRLVAADFAAGKALPFWFVVAVPIWMLFWVAGSYGVSRIVDRIFEKFSLSLSFRAASRFSTEEQRIHQEGLAESAVSSVEARSLIDHGSDGTDAVVAAVPRTVEPGVRIAKEVELGGEPQGLPAGPSYDLLEDDMDDPDVLRAVGGAKPTAFVIESDRPGAAAGSADPEGMPVELVEPDLPAVPSDSGPPLRRVTPPRVDALASRAMVKKLQQLLTSFERALFENDDEAFIRDNEDELATISEEQKAMLRAMANSGPLLSAIAGVQSERAADFLMGRAAPPAAVGTGAVLDQDQLGDVSVTGGAVVPVEAVVEDDAVGPADGETSDDVGQVVVADSIAKMGSIFSGYARRGRRAIADDVVMSPSPLPVEEPEDGVRDDASGDESPSTSEEGATASAASRPAPRVDAGPVMTPRPPVFPSTADIAIPRPPGEVRRPVESVEDVSGEAVSGVIASVDVAGRKVTFDMDIEERQDPEDDAGKSSVVADHPEEVGSDETHSEEDEMSALIFDRRICKQVLGLISGSDSPNDKAKDVISFERDNAGISVAQVLNSRSFDEHVGSTEAVAVRHMWREVQKVLAQSSVERLVADFERLNDRGQAMVDEPHTMTSAAFYAFESECSRMLTAAMASDETIAATVPLVNVQRDILDMLRDIKRRREEAAAAPAQPSTLSVVRQKIPAGQDVEASRGRGMLGGVLDGARKGRGLLRGGEASRRDQAETPASEGPSGASVETAQELAPTPSPTEITSVSNRVPTYGDEDYVSAHAIGTDEHDFDMRLHAHAIEMKRELAARAVERAEQERAEREAQEAREAAERREREEREERQRQEAIDASRSDERRRMLERDEAFVKSERERAEAAAREMAASAEARAAEALAARTRAEREERENARSLDDQRVLDEYRARLDGHSLPTRFREGDIPQRFVRLTDLRDQRKRFYSMSVSGKIEGLDDVPEAVASPARRSSMMLDVMIGVESSAIYETILGILDPPNPEDAEAVKSMVAEGDERKFVDSIQGAIKTGMASERALREADAKLLEMHEATKVAKGVAGVREEVARLGEELGEAERRNAALEAERVAAERRASDAEAERVRLLAQIDRMTKEAAGIVEDDFQRLLDKYATPVTGVPVKGMYLLSDEDKRGLSLVITTPAAAIQGGAVKVGDRMMPFRDMVDFVLDVSRSMMTERREVFFTDRMLKPLLGDSGSLSFLPIDRSVRAFLDAAEIASVVVDPEDMLKGD